MSTFCIVPFTSYWVVIMLDELLRMPWTIAIRTKVRPARTVGPVALRITNGSFVRDQWWQDWLDGSDVETGTVPSRPVCNKLRGDRPRLCSHSRLTFLIRFRCTMTFLFIVFHITLNLNGNNRPSHPIRIGYAKHQRECWAYDTSDNSCFVCG